MLHCYQLFWPLQLVLQISCFLKSVITLSVTLDTHLTMKNQVINLVRTANVELRRINSIHHYLSVEAARKLVLAFVMSRLDHCNSLLYGCPQYLINRLQKVQNNAACLILKVPKTDHTTPHLHTLPWFPVNAKIQYKMCSLWFNAINSSGPQYLAEQLKIYAPSRQLRSSADTCTLCILSVHKKVMANVPFHTLHLLSGTIFLKLFETHNLLFLSNSP